MNPNMLSRLWLIRREETLKAHMIRAAGGSLFLRVANTLLVIATTLVLARIMGARDYGVYAYIISWVSLLSVPAAMGFDTLLVREVAKYKASGKWDALKGVIRWTDRYALRISFGFVIIWGCVWRILCDRFGPQTNLASLIAAGLLPLQVLGFLRRGAVQGIGRVIEAQAPLMLALPGAFLVLIAVFGLVSDISPAKAIGAQLLASFLALLLGTRIRRKHLPREADLAEPSYFPRQWLKSALPLMFVGVAGIVNQRLSTVMAGTMLGPEAAGILDVAIKGSMVVNFILLSVNMPLAPAVAQLYSKGEMKRLQGLVTRCARAALAASVPVAAMLIVFANRVLSFFGKDFVAGNMALGILVLGQAVNVGAGSVGVLLNMTGYEWDTAKGVGIASAVNFILNLYLIPLFHIEGAAIANAVSMIVWNVLMAKWVYQRLGIRSFGF
ncbi:MAG: hypothetical protein DRH12_12525 [Deltaproteobacteria bacterium]|nr:MAG: hypothetical protein DRH12_12525 [Deltaproteobacteria bacterium]